MKMMITLFTVGVIFFAGVAAHPGGGVVAPGRRWQDLSRQDVYETLTGYGIPEESLTRWESRLQPIVDVYRRDGPHSPELHRQYAELVHVPQETYNKWEPRLQEVIEVYRKDGPHSPELHREYGRLGVETLYHTGYIQRGYPAELSFPSKKVKYVKVRDHVVITDLKQILNVVPYDDSYANVCLPEAEGVKVLRQLGGQFRKRFVKTVSTKTHATPEQAGLLLDRLGDRLGDPAYYGY